MKALLTSVSAVALIAAASSADAGPKSGTLNIAIAEQVEGVSPVYAPSGESQLYGRVVFDSLLAMDLNTGKVLPHLASSWKQTSPTSWEFELRKDVTFHDGSKFDADDAVYTLNFVSDPKVKFRLKNRFLWIKRAEKLGPHTIRITSKRPEAMVFSRLAVGMAMFPSDVHGALKKKSDFGRKPIGTGAYRVASFDDNKGITLVARDKYVQANPTRPVPAIKRISIRPIPDEQTRLAEMLIGKAEMTRLVSKDIASSMKSRSGFNVTSVNGLQYNYLYLDAADRTGVGFLKDLRVRQAISHAINRDELKKDIVVGGEGAFPMKALCIPFQIGCKSTTAPLPFDPAKAKRLLAEAGHANGFDIELSAIARTRGVAEAISGYLRKVGIRASIKQITFVAYRKLQRAGKLQALVNIFGSGGVPDTGRVLGFHFNNPSRDYAKDKRINEIASQTDRTYDAALRNRLFTEALDRNNQQVYVIPLAAAPQVFLHTDNLVVPNSTLNGYGAVLNLLKWK